MTAIAVYDELRKADKHSKWFLILEVTMKLQIILEPSEEGGYTVTVPALPGPPARGTDGEGSRSASAHGCVSPGHRCPVGTRRPARGTRPLRPAARARDRGAAACDAVAELA